MNSIIVVAHNIRSTHNVGAIFRTCEGFGVEKLILSGYTPYPKLHRDSRLPHIADKMTVQISKTALGAEKLVPYTFNETPPLDELKNNGYHVIGLEQDERSINLSDLVVPKKLVLLLGEEVAGISTELRDECDTLVEIPMKGKKESFNVSVAAGIALYGLTATS